MRRAQLLTYISEASYHIKAGIDHVADSRFGIGRGSTLRTDEVETTDINTDLRHDSSYDASISSTDGQSFPHDSDPVYVSD